MKLLAALQIYADSYLFFVHDGDAEASPTSFSDELDGSRVTDEGGYDLGYLFNEHTICFGGLADLNQYRIELFISEQPPEFKDAQRVLAIPLDIPSGEVKISTLYEEPVYTAKLSGGRYIVYCLGFNLGKDPDAEEQLTETPCRVLEDEIGHMSVNHERYQIVLVPEGDISRQERVLRGGVDLEAIRTEIN